MGSRKRGESRRLGLFLAALALAGAVAIVPAGSGAEPPDPAEAPVVDLEQLLILPDGDRYTIERKGGLTRGEWRVRFQEIEAALAEQRSELEVDEVKLGEMASTSSAWKVSPIPGLGSDADAPIDFQLRQEIRRHRAEIERLEKKLRSLRIQANLAGVPEEWRS